MIGDDSRGRARAGARDGAKERDAWLGTTRAGARARARATVHKNAMHGWGRLARAHARARATVHKNTMIEDDARGRHDAQEFQKSQNREIHDFQKKNQCFWNLIRQILLCGAILAAFHTNFLLLIRIQRSHGLIPARNIT